MPSLEIEPDLRLPWPLRPYQWQGVKFLVERDSALLADDMGLGKTVQVAVALSILFKHPEVRRALVVAPAALRLNWERELNIWAPKLSVRRLRGGREERQAAYDLPFHILVASYDQIRLDALDLARRLRFDVVVLDEAQKIKNRSSRNALACGILQRQRSWALSGTPLENNVSELVSVFSFVRFGLLKNGLPITRMHEAMKPHFLRRLAEDVFDELPPIIDQVLPLELGENQASTYGELWSKRSRSADTGEMLKLITKLKQVCNYDPATGDSCKLDATLELLNSLLSSGKKVILFSQYVESLKWLTAKLPYRSLLYHGGLKEEEKDAILGEFRSGSSPGLLLMSLGAGAAGLNLQEAEAVIFFDRWWNPAVEDQALHRAYRFGRKVPLRVYRFLVADTIEQRIQTLIEEKAMLFDLYVNDADSAAVQPLTAGDLRKILDLV